LRDQMRLVNQSIKIVADEAWITNIFA